MDLANAQAGQAPHLVNENAQLKADLATALEELKRLNGIVNQQRKKIEALEGLSDIPEEDAAKLEAMIREKVAAGLPKDMAKRVALDQIEFDKAEARAAEAAKAKEQKPEQKPEQNKSKK